MSRRHKIRTSRLPIHGMYGSFCVRCGNWSNHPYGLRGEKCEGGTALVVKSVNYKK